MHSNKSSFDFKSSNTNQFLFPSSKFQSKSTCSNLIPLKTRRIKQIYNSISNIYDSQEINRGLESLETVKEKISLVDFVISRRQEIKKAEEIERFNKITPLINKMKKNFLMKKSEDSEKSSESIASFTHLGNGISHYRRFSLRGKNLIPQEETKPRIVLHTKLPKIEENSQKIKDNDILKEQNNQNRSSTPMINVIKVQDNDSPNLVQRRRASLLTVVTKFNQMENEKLKRNGSVSNKHNQRNSLMINQEIDVNARIYHNDFHLIPIESPRPSDNSKKYEISTSLLKKSTYKTPLDTKKIDEVLEKELLKFMTENKETININFLNLEKLHKYQNIAMIESKVKGKFKDFLKQDKINNLQKKYYFRDTFLHKCRDSCKKCLKKHEKPVEIHQKTSNTFKKNMKKNKNFKSMDFMQKQINRFFIF